MADDQSRPFPFISNDSLNIAIRLRSEEDGKHEFATVRVPNIFPRLVKLPDGENDVIMLEDIVQK